MNEDRIAELEREIQHHEAILSLIKELYMETREDNKQTPTVKQIFDTISYVHDRMAKMRYELKKLKDDEAASS